MKFSRYSLLFILPILAIFGWGCNKKQQPAQVNQGQEQPYLPPEKVVDKNSDEYKRAQLDQAVKNFRLSRSFKAKINREDSKGSVSGELNYLKPLRMKATLKTSEGQELAMVVIGSTVYVQSGKESWAIQNDPSAKTFAEDFFTAMAVNDETLASFGIPVDAPMAMDYDEVMRCNVFKTKYKIKEALHDISFCVNDKPEIVSIIMQTEDGQAKTEYSNYNDLMVIERPMLPLLEPKVMVSP